MTLPDLIRRLHPRDPRLYQIATLATLLVYGLIWLEFEITAARALVLLATVLLTQAVCDHLAAGRPIPRQPPVAVNIKSALISGLSLCLLLRTNYLELAILAAVLTIAGKFVIRVR